MRKRIGAARLMQLLSSSAYRDAWIAGLRVAVHACNAGKRTIKEVLAAVFAGEAQKSAPHQTRRHLCPRFSALPAISAPVLARFGVQKVQRALPPAAPLLPSVASVSLKAPKSVDLPQR